MLLPTLIEKESKSVPSSLLYSAFLHTPRQLQSLELYKFWKGKLGTNKHPEPISGKTSLLVKEGTVLSEDRHFILRGVYCTEDRTLENHTVVAEQISVRRKSHCINHNTFHSGCQVHFWIPSAVLTNSSHCLDIR